jgi:hypothetical protein
MFMTNHGLNLNTIKHIHPNWIIMQELSKMTNGLYLVDLREENNILIKFLNTTLTSMNGLT